MRGALAVLLLSALARADDDPIDPTKYKFPAEAKSVEAPRETSPRERAHLGVSPAEADERERGVLLADVPEDGPAGQAGLRPGDRILRFDGKEVGDYDALARRIAARRPGDSVEVVADRDGEELVFQVALGAKSSGMLVPWRKSAFRLGLVLFEFSDCARNPAFTRTDFERLLFSRGEYTGTGPSGERVYGSLADFTAENSGGKLAVTGRVFDWVTLDEPRAYFEEKPMGHREAARKLLPRALDLVRRRDGEECLDGLDGIVFLYAGRQTYLRPRLLWPHRANIRAGGRTLPYYLTAEGGRHFNAINVHVHEFGHMLGLPDQYGKNHATGIGKWCTMAVGHMGGGESGVHRPFHLCLWCKERLGWAKVTTVRAGEAQWLKLAAIEKDPTMAVRILVDPDGGDSIYLENRQRIGFDSDLEGTGLLIWRVRRGGAIDLVESHGRKVTNASLVEPEEIPWPSFYNRDFTPATAPASPAGVYLTDIVEQGGVVYFKIGVEKAGETRGLRKRADY
ncbi:MAG: M6 family metalloprotease domain-containing protein [Planctomycetes bacterium]|nr:M6 family metalloprotease domain-containing protein [Planctomycetota bacterium]